MAAVEPPAPVEITHTIPVLDFLTETLVSHVSIFSYGFSYYNPRERRFMKKTILVLALLYSAVGQAYDTGANPMEDPNCVPVPGANAQNPAGDDGGYCEHLYYSNYREWEIQ